MDTDADGLLEYGSVAEHIKRLEQHLAELDGALGQLGEKIREAEQKSKYVIREVAPMFDEQERH
jgi:prefoldin subunit 5